MNLRSEVVRICAKLWLSARHISEASIQLPSETEAINPPMGVMKLLETDTE